MKADSVRGHLDGMILAVLEAGPNHGYAVIEELRVRSGGSIDVPTGTVYPALRRLERAALVSARWSTVDGRKRRTYTLTRAGVRALGAERGEWAEFTSVVQAVLLPATEAPVRPSP